MEGLKAFRVRQDQSWTVRMLVRSLARGDGKSPTERRR